jgi:hypothetical protein
MGTHVFELVDCPSEKSQLLLHSLGKVPKLVTIGSIVVLRAKLLGEQLLLHSLKQQQKRSNEDEQGFLRSDQLIY